jgi:hypothetical protein
LPAKRVRPGRPCRRMSTVVTRPRWVPSIDFCQRLATSSTLGPGSTLSAFPARRVEFCSCQLGCPSWRPQALAMVELPLTLNWSRPGGFFGSSTGVIGLEFTNSCFVRAQRPTSCATSTACCWGTYGTASGPLRRCRSRANPRGPMSGLWTDSSASCRCGSRAQTSSAATPLLKPGSGEIRTFAKTRRLGPFARESVAALLLTL